MISIIHNNVYSFYCFFKNNATLPEQFQKQCHIAGTDPKSNIKIVVEGAKIQMFSHSLFWLGIGALIKRCPNLPDHATDSLQTKSPR